MEIPGGGGSTVKPPWNRKSWGGGGSNWKKTLCGGYGYFLEPHNLTQKCINNSLHLAQKYALIFVQGHYLFREANSFARAQLEENC